MIRKKIISLVSIIVVITCLTLFTTAFSPIRLPKGVSTTTRVLSHEQTLEIAPILNANVGKEQIKLSENSAERISNSAIILSLENDTIQMSKVLMGLTENKNYISYWDISGYNPGLLRSIEFERAEDSYRLYNLALDYCHSLFRSKTARKILFEEALETLYATCLSYPKDFRKMIISDLKDLETFARNMDLETISENEDYQLVYWKEFIYRRYANDEVPQEEIISYIIEARNRINEIDPNSLPDAIHEIVINNMIQIQYDLAGISISSLKSKNAITYPYDMEVELESVTYYKDHTGDFYKISGRQWQEGNDDEEGFWEAFNNLYDINMEIVE